MAKKERAFFVCIMIVSHYLILLLAIGHLMCLTDFWYPQQITHQLHQQHQLQAPALQYFLQLLLHLLLLDITENYKFQVFIIIIIVIIIIIITIIIIIMIVPCRQYHGLQLGLHGSSCPNSLEPANPSSPS